ncbi:Transmembrane protein 19 [Ananas comosus]|uniref:Transmembrane protein 19 n=1 Tax=Ananas comosus TaxID=4615 RepID=A0A199UQQ6_ANACO|nr:Transmembrane protein 19 [Ananas comosus]
MTRSRMDPSAIRFLVSLLASSAIAARSFRRRSVDLSGVLVGIPVMVRGASSGVFLRRRSSRGREERSAPLMVQVLANSSIATVLVVIVAFLTGGQDRCLDTKESNYVTGLIGGIIGHYACCNGDTWSSELGILSRGQPRLITNFKKVRKGTNGAVTVDGFLAAAAAGFVIGLTFVLVGFLTSECAPKVARRQLLVVPIAAAAGLCGSLIDSLLGATLQFSGYCTLRKKVVANPGPTVSKISGRNILDNHGVNVVSVLLTTLLTAIACLHIF